MAECHIIPGNEDRLHTRSRNCVCNPRVVEPGLRGHQMTLVEHRELSGAPLTPPWIGNGAGGYQGDLGTRPESPEADQERPKAFACAGVVYLSVGGADIALETQGAFILRGELLEAIISATQWQKENPGIVRTKSDLSAEVEKLRRLLGQALAVIEHEVDQLEPAHKGPCGPEAGCDCSCQDASRFAELMQQIRETLKRV